MRNILVLVLLLVIVCGCDEQRNVDEAMTKEKIVEIASGHVKERFPQSVDMLEREAVVVDGDGFWEVTWELPELTLGGAPVVKISKANGEVVESYHTQ